MREYAEQLLFTGGKNRQTNPNVSSTLRHPKQLPSRIEDPHTCNTTEILTPIYVVDGPRIEHTKDAKRASVEPTDAQVEWQKGH